MPSTAPPSAPDSARDSDTATPGSAPGNPQTWRDHYASRPWLRHYGQMPTQLPVPQYHNLVEMLVESAATYGTRKAFTTVTGNGMNGSMTYAQVDAQSNDVAVYLREHLGLPPGSRVAIQMLNSLSYPVAAFGILKAGCVLVNVNPLYTAEEMVKQFNDAQVETLLVIDLFADKLAQVVPRTPLKHVVISSIAQGFPVIPKFIVHNVLKYWSRMVPEVKLPGDMQAVSFPQMLRTGNHLRKHASIEVKQYWQHLRGDDIAVLQYTGGTTGIAKGARLSHGNLLKNVDQLDATARSHMDEGKEVMLTCLPLYHIFAFSVNLLAFFKAGGHNILVPVPRPIQKLQRAIENYPITWMTGVNTLFNAMINEEWFWRHPPKHLRAAIAGGAALHESVAKRWEEVTGTRLIEGYGLTESSPVVTFNPLEGDVRPGSIGVPVPDTDILLIDDEGQVVAPGEPGELLVAGPQVMQGYWEKPEETAKTLIDGWLHTGDIAVMDDDGFLYIVDRKKDMVIVSGFNVYPNEIEDAIAKIHAVQEVAVIGVPDSNTGEAVRAYVVKRGEVTAEEIIQHCRQHLAPYKVPKQIEFREELPTTPIGKILRKDLRQEYLEAHPENQP
ncbi:MAG: long-chain fatty acid--CoA ligase [Halomonadaceae bacterium]|nr:MAG: long-chain fatty acid--CoA ligase [Halomonadaceae bacterium]